MKYLFYNLDDETYYNVFAESFEIAAKSLVGYLTQNNFDTVPCLFCYDNNAYLFRYQRNPLTDVLTFFRVSHDNSIEKPVLPKQITNRQTATGKDVPIVHKNPRKRLFAIETMPTDAETLKSVCIEKKKYLKQKNNLSINQNQLSL